MLSNGKRATHFGVRGEGFTVSVVRKSEQKLVGKRIGDVFESKDCEKECECRLVVMVEQEDPLYLAVAYLVPEC